MSDLTDFLLARIGEDETRASGWSDDGPWGEHSPGLMWMDPDGHPIYAPRARVLADCVTKRRIVQLLEDDLMSLQRRPKAEHILWLLALPYIDHPNHREEWKP